MMIRTQRTTQTKWAVIGLYAASVIVFADMYLTQPILPRLSKEFGISPSTAGLTISAVVLLVAAASLTSGPLSDMFGRKPVMVWSFLLLSVPTLLCALSSTFGALLIFRALQGVFIPGFTAVVIAYIGDLVEPEKLGPVVGGFIAANVAGGLLGRVSSGILTDLFSWHTVFEVFAVLSFATGVALALVLPRDGTRSGDGWRQAYRGMVAHLRNRRLIGAFIIGGTLFFAFLGLFTYLPYYLTAAPFNLPAGIVAFAYVTYAAGMVTSPLAGRLSARISRRRLIAIGLLITMLGVVLTLIQVVPIIVISLLIVCSGMFTAQAIAPAFVNVVAKEAKGGAGALYLMFYYVGGTLGGVLPGLAWQSFGWIGVVTVCLGALLIGLLSNWLLCGVSRRGQP